MKKENSMDSGFMIFPRALFFDKELRTLSDKAKLLYMIYRDRLDLSNKNNSADSKKFADEHGTYIYYTYESLSEVTGWTRPTIAKVKKELIKAGLISVSKQFNGADKIRVHDITESKENLLTQLKNLTPESKKTLPRKLKKLTPESKENLLRGVKKVNSNYTKYNYTEYSHTEDNKTYKNNSNLEIEKNKKTLSNEILVSRRPSDELINFIVNYLGVRVTPAYIDEIGEQENKYGYALVKEAWQRASNNNKMTVQYVNGILNNWQNEGVTCLADIKNKGNKNGKRKSDKIYPF